MRYTRPRRHKRKTRICLYVCNNVVIASSRGTALQPLRPTSFESNDHDFRSRRTSVTSWVSRRPNTPGLLFPSRFAQTSRVRSNDTTYFQQSASLILPRLYSSYSGSAAFVLNLHLTRSPTSSTHKYDTHITPDRRISNHSFFVQRSFPQPFLPFPNFPRLVT